MPRIMHRAFAVLVIGLLPSWAVARSPAEIVTQADEVLTDLQKVPMKAIPAALLADAQAVAIVPRVVKAGFVIGGKLGHGLILMRNENGAWSEPQFIRLAGASVGFQVGVESTDVVLVIKSKKSLERLLEGKRKLTLGADAAVAAGPVGRNAKVGTDGVLQAEIYSYSRSRGLFAGVSLEGATLLLDKKLNREYARDERESTKQAVSTLMLQVAKAAGPDLSALPAAQP